MALSGASPPPRALAFFRPASPPHGIERAREETRVETLPAMGQDHLDLWQTVLLPVVTSWPVDAVLMPVNPAEAVLGGFLDRVMGAAQDLGLVVIGMKVLEASNYISPAAGVAQKLLIRFALSKDITTAIVGCSSPQEVWVLARAGREFQPLLPDEEKKLADLFGAPRKELAFYRVAF